MAVSLLRGSPCDDCGAQRRTHCGQFTVGPCGSLWGLRFLTVHCAVRRQGSPAPWHHQGRETIPGTFTVFGGLECGGYAHRAAPGHIAARPCTFHNLRCVSSSHRPPPPPSALAHARAHTHCPLHVLSCCRSRMRWSQTAPAKSGQLGATFGEGYRKFDRIFEVCCSHARGH